MNNIQLRNKLLYSVKAAFPAAMRTAWWVVKLTVFVSLIVTILNYLGVIKWFSQIVNPVFAHIGLQGDAAIAYFTGYFVNIYSAIAVINTLDMSYRSITIIAVMCLCSHNMIIETAVQKKTGSSAIRILIIRTLSAFVSAFALNIILPQGAEIRNSETLVTTQDIMSIMSVWFISTSKLVVKMVILITILTILQRMLNEFGVIKILSKILNPLLSVFGLPAKTSLLWIIANTLGLAYGAAVMIEEWEQGNITQTESDLLNHHICVSHSNLEDLILFASIGASILWMLVIRLALAFILVWERRIEMYLVKRRKVVV